MSDDATLPTVDRSDEADLRRFRWILKGNGFFMEEEGLCAWNEMPEEQDRARRRIDEAMTHGWDRGM